MPSCLRLALQTAALSLRGAAWAALLWPLDGVSAATLAESITAHDVLLLHPRELTVFFLVVTLMSAAVNYTMGRVQVLSRRAVATNVAATIAAARGEDGDNGRQPDATGRPPSAVGGIANIINIMVKSASAVILRVGVPMGACFIITESASAALVSWKIVITLTYASFVVTFFMMITLVAVLIHIAGCFLVNDSIRRHERREIIINKRGGRDTSARERRESWGVVLRVRRELVMAAAAAFPPDALTVLQGAEPMLVPNEVRFDLEQRAAKELRAIATERKAAKEQRERYLDEVRQKRADEWGALDGADAEDAGLIGTTVSAIPGPIGRAIVRYREKKRERDRQRSGGGSGAAAVGLLSYKEEAAIEAASVEYAHTLEAFKQREQRALRMREQAEQLKDITLGSYLDAVLVDPDMIENLAVRASAWLALVPYSILIITRQAMSRSQADVLENPVFDFAVTIGVFGCVPCAVQIVIAYWMARSLQRYSDDLCLTTRGGGRASRRDRIKKHVPRRQDKSKDNDDVRSETSASSAGSSAAPSTTASVAVDLDHRPGLMELYHEVSVAEGLRSRRNAVQYMPFQALHRMHAVGQACFLAEMLYAAVVAVEHGYRPLETTDRRLVVMLGCAFIPVALSMALQPLMTVLHALTSRSGVYVLHRAAYLTVVLPAEAREAWALQNPTLARTDVARERRNAGDFGGPAAWKILQQLRRLEDRNKEAAQQRRGDGGAGTQEGAGGMGAAEDDDDSRQGGGVTSPRQTFATASRDGGFVPPAPDDEPGVAVMTNPLDGSPTSAAAAAGNGTGATPDARSQATARGPPETNSAAAAAAAVLSSHEHASVSGPVVSSAGVAKEQEAAAAAPAAAEEDATKGRRVGFYFGDQRDADLHAMIPGSGINLPGRRGHHAAIAGSGTADAFHDYVALEQQRRSMQRLELRVRCLIQQLKGERVYTEELKRRSGVVKSVLVGRKKLRTHAEAMAAQEQRRRLRRAGGGDKEAAAAAAEDEEEDVKESDLQWCVAPMESTLEHLQLIALGRGDEAAAEGSTLPEAADALDLKFGAGHGGPDARRRRARRDRDRREMRKLLPLFTPEGAFELTEAGASMHRPSALSSATINPGSRTSGLNLGDDTVLPRGNERRPPAAAAAAGVQDPLGVPGATLPSHGGGVGHQSAVTNIDHLSPIPPPRRHYNKNNASSAGASVHFADDPDL